MPFDEPLLGLAAIAEFWENERDGPDETCALDAEIVAVDGLVGVARVEAHYGSPVSQSCRDLWIVTLDSTAACVLHVRRMAVLPRAAARGPRATERRQ